MGDNRFLDDEDLERLYRETRQQIIEAFRIPSDILDESHSTLALQVKHMRTQRIEEWANRRTPGRIGDGAEGGDDGE